MREVIQIEDTLQKRDGIKMEECGVSQESGYLDVTATLGVGRTLERGYGQPL